MTAFDTCIIGQGLAGATLAWVLHQQGQRVAVVDDNEPSSSSRIAAGLITPVTGKRFVKSDHFDKLVTTAIKFYQTIETETETTFLNQQHSVRLFANKDERELFLKKSLTHFPNAVQVLEKPINETFFETSNGGFEMKQAARLNVPRYLDVSQKFFSEMNVFFESKIDIKKEIELTNNAVRIPKLGLTAERIIFCQGFSGSKNYWFQTVPFDAVKGEVLTVRIPQLNEPRVVHRGIWLAGIGNDLYRLGATYDHEHLDLIPTPSGKEELCARLAEFLRLPFEVINHQAAVRPVIVRRQPVIGFHSQFSQLGYFNGLGSKGSLQAPWYAQLFSKTICKKKELPPEFDVAQYLNFQNKTKNHR